MKTNMTSRELEIAQLEIAIERTKKKHAELHDLAFKSYEKLATQEAELRFQKMMVRFSPPNASDEPMATARTEPRKTEQP